MANTHSSIATDSEAALRELLGDDAIATFESDPAFLASNPTANASTENVTVQRDTDDSVDSDEEDDEDYDEEDEEDDDDDDLEEADDDEEDEEEEVDEEAEVALTAAARA